MSGLAAAAPALLPAASLEAGSGHQSPGLSAAHRSSGAVMKTEPRRGPVDGETQLLTFTMEGQGLPPTAHPLIARMATEPGYYSGQPQGPRGQTPNLYLPPASIWNFYAKEAGSPLP